MQTAGASSDLAGRDSRTLGLWDMAKISRDYELKSGSTLLSHRLVPPQRGEWSKRNSVQSPGLRAQRGGGQCYLRAHSRKGPPPPTASLLLSLHQSWLAEV